MTEVTKYFLAVINFITMLLGVALAAAGVYGLAVGSQVSHLVSLWLPVLIMILGLSVVIVSVLGLYSVFTESTYFGVLMTILFLQVVMSSMALARQGDVDLLLYDAWGRAYDRDPGLIRKIEKSYACCGFASVHDRAIPKDCIDDEEFGFVLPCRDLLGAPLKGALRTLGVSGLVLAALLGLALLMALTMYTNVIGGPNSYYSDRDATRLAEARHLLREGSIPALQHPSSYYSSVPSTFTTFPMALASTAGLPHHQAPQSISSRGAPQLV